MMVKPIHEKRYGTRPTKESRTHADASTSQISVWSSDAGQNINPTILPKVSRPSKKRNLADGQVNRLVPQESQGGLRIISTIHISKRHLKQTNNYVVVGIIDLFVMICRNAGC